MSFFGPWTTPPVQTTAMIDEDGTILDDFSLLWGEPITGAGSAAGGNSSAFARRNAYFLGDDIATINAETNLLQRDDGTPPAHYDYIYQASNGGGSCEVHASAFVAGWPSPIDELSFGSGFGVAHFADVEDYFPPEYFTDPNVIGIEFSTTSPGSILASWVGLAMWVMNGSLVDTSGGSEFESQMLLTVTALGASVEDVYYAYGTGFVPVWFDTTTYPFLTPPTATDKIVGSTLGVYATPGAGHVTDVGVRPPDAPPVIAVIGLGGDPLPFLDSHRNYPIGAWLSCVEDGLGEHWPWVLSNVGSEIIKVWDGICVPHGGIRYQPPDYRLEFSDVPPQRTYPRNDGRSMSTARSWPLPDSRQSSQRAGPAATYW